MTGCESLCGCVGGDESQSVMGILDPFWENAGYTRTLCVQTRRSRLLGFPYRSAMGRVCCHRCRSAAPSLFIREDRLLQYEYPKNVESLIKLTELIPNALHTHLLAFFGGERLHQNAEDIIFCCMHCVQSSSRMAVRVPSLASRDSSLFLTEPLLEAGSEDS